MLTANCMVKLDVKQEACVCIVCQGIVMIGYNHQASRRHLLENQ
uniref:Uncharacterized protein n=1 Tax=Arundo donax TaxID=35708 RepID=A0A0A9GJM6_ARUDO